MPPRLTPPPPLFYLHSALVAFLSMVSSVLLNEPVPTRREDTARELPLSPAYSSGVLARGSTSVVVLPASAPGGALVPYVCLA